MALAFNTTTSALEDELINLILEGHIQARIDSQNKVIQFLVISFLNDFQLIHLFFIQTLDFICKRC